MVAGDGPGLEELRRSFHGKDWAFFPGRVPQKILSYFYSGSDLLDFPSGADTFGMAVLEAQACSLPAVVSDAGGPQEIIADGQTGYVARDCDLEDWYRALNGVLDLAEHNLQAYRSLRDQAVARVRERFDWSLLLDGLLNPPASAREPLPVAG